MSCVYSALRRVLTSRQIGAGVPRFRAGVRYPSHVTVTYVCMVCGLPLVGGKVAGVCRRAISTLSIDRCSYPDDSVRVYRVLCECPSDTPFRSVGFASRSLPPFSSYTRVNLYWPRRTNTTGAPRSICACGTAF